MDYFNELDISNISGFIFTISYSAMHIYFIAEYFLTYDIKKDYIEIEKNYNLKSQELHKIKLLNEKLDLELKKTKILLLKDTENESKNKEEKDYGNGKIRYKLEGDKIIYYHGIGHLEKKYNWWKPALKHCIIEYKDSSKVKHDEWETDDISKYCNNCVRSDMLNKRTRTKTYYVCRGHSLNK